VGYGATNDSGDGPGTRRRRDGLAVECVGEACTEADVLATEWMGEGGICNGDSGGPALDAGGQVMGVTSRGEAGCGLAVYGSTVGWAEWIQNLGVCAAAMGNSQAPAWTTGATLAPEFCMPVGAVCSAGTDCPSGRCVSQEGHESYCSRPCSVDWPCPTDYRCADHEGEPVCIPDRPIGPPLAHVDRDEDCSVGAGSSSGRHPWWLVLALCTVLRRIVPLARTSRQRTAKGRASHTAITSPV
jgi:hypothetical protein